MVRPATAILRRLAEASSEAAPVEQQEIFSVYSYGFEILWPLIREESSGFWKMMAVHLAPAAEQALVSEVLQLLVALMRPALQLSCFEFYEDLEAHSIRQCIYVRG